MKKLIVLSLITLLCLPLAVYAASIGGAETQGKGKFAIGLDQEFVFSRDMKLDKISGDTAAALAAKGITTGRIKLDKSLRTMYKVSYGLLDNLDFYVRLGFADSKTEVNYTQAGNNYKGIYDSDIGFAYGCGLKGTYSLDNWLVGVDLQYLRSRQDWTPADDFEGEGDKITIQEWQVSPYVGYKIGNFVPYLGVKYSDLRMKAEWGGDDSGEWEKAKADDNFGTFLGLDYKPSDNWTLNIEGRFIDETAMSVGATYKF